MYIDRNFFFFIIWQLFVIKIRLKKFFNWSGREPYLTVRISMELPTIYIQLIINQIWTISRLITVVSLDRIIIIIGILTWNMFMWRGGTELYRMEDRSERTRGLNKVDQSVCPSVLVCWFNWNNGLSQVDQWVGPNGLRNWCAVNLNF